MAFDINAIQQGIPSPTSINVTAPNVPASGGSSVGQTILGLDPNSASNPELFVFNAIVIFIWVIGIVTAITFIYAGIRYITAGGDAEKAESAKKIIIGSVIGMLIILASYAFFNFTAHALNNPTQGKTQQGVQDLMQYK